MAGKTDYLENAWQKLLFWGTAIANIADNAAASPMTTIYMSLHSSDPTDAPATEQTTNEVAYTGYARVAMTRDNTKWAITGGVVSPVADIEWPANGGGSTVVATHVGFGTASSGTGKMLYTAALTPSISAAPGGVPVITAASTLTED